MGMRCHRFFEGAGGDRSDSLLALGRGPGVTHFRGRSCSVKAVCQLCCAVLRQVMSC